MYVVNVMSKGHKIKILMLEVVSTHVRRWFREQPRHFLSKL